MSEAVRLTGRTQLRVHSPLFGSPKVVLQVEYEWQEDSFGDYNGMPRWLAGSGWRDATPEDLINAPYLRTTG